MKIAEREPMMIVLAIGDALAVVIALALAKTAVNKDDLIP